MHCVKSVIKISREILMCFVIFKERLNQCLFFMMWFGVKGKLDMEFKFGGGGVQCCILSYFSLKPLECSIIMRF